MSARRSRLWTYAAVIVFATVAGTVGGMITVGVTGIGAWFALGPATTPVETGLHARGDVETPPAPEEPAAVAKDTPSTPTDAPAPEAAHLPGDPVLDGRSTDLTHPDPGTRLRAIGALELDRDATAALRWLMSHDPDEDVRNEAFEVLVYQAERGVGDAPAQATALGDVLMDRLRFSQRRAAHGYGRVGTDLDPLDHVLRRGSPTARNETIRAVVDVAERTGQQAQARALLEGARDRITSRTQRKTLEEALEELATP